VWAVGVNYKDSFVELGLSLDTYMYPVSTQAEFAQHRKLLRIVIASTSMQTFSC
jgi:hypothetical protein